MKKIKIVKKLQKYDHNVHRTLLLGALLLLISSPLTVSALKAVRADLPNPQSSAVESHTSHEEAQLGAETDPSSTVSTDSAGSETKDIEPAAHVTAPTTVATKPAEQVPPPKTAAPAPVAAPVQPTANSTAPCSSSGGDVSSVNFINTVRCEAGKAPLMQNGTIDQWAMQWAVKLSEECNLRHQDLSQFLGRNIGPVAISSIAENVGYASNGTQAVLQGLKNSPGHYSNMIGNYSYVGTGIVVSGSGACTGHTYTAQIFAK